MTVKTINGHVQEIEDVTSDLRILYIKLEQTFTFKAGQYINVHQNGYDERSYSIANTPLDSNIIELHIRRGENLSAYLCNKIISGSSIAISGPFGNCTYKAQCKKPILALAGGAGLAQIKSIVEKALKTNRTNPVYLYHGAQEVSGLYKDNYFKQLAKQDNRLIYHPIISQEKPENETIKYGFLMDHVKQDFDSLKDFRTYMCGTPEMVIALEKILIEKGIDPKRIHADK
ncbi:MAG: hypothetical protein JKY11_00245 [Alphaproteobacteria bacterium]|nr:hypothetical protein [Alphaproteobacteria bacterium]